MSRRLRAAALAAVLSFVVASPAVAAPLSFPSRIVDGFQTPPAPEVTAPAWLVYDESSDTVLASELATEERAIASTTKIMTALVALESADPASIVTVSRNAADTGEREIGLVAGEQLPLSALIKAALVHSANDAATAIAEHVGGSVSGFVDMMNAKAEELGLTHTRFANPHGLDAPDHYSSAHDLLVMARAAMEYLTFRDAVRARILVFPDAPDGTERMGQATNLLLHDYEGMSGVKTGFTSRANLTMVASAERDGRRLYAVVLGSDGRRAHFADVELLFDWAYESLGIFGTVSTGNPYVSVKERVDPAPLVATLNTEAYMHLAAQGLMTSPPIALVEQPEPEPPAVVVVERHAEAPMTPWQAATHWWNLISGS